ncbi:hypothetical protein OHB41_50705 [Streptomyces sp. NBC_01571]|uniref:hypothetical protein n=1 Tax=Streptomyces sp. NBC_01571 TaxID=2975883 RepID=UPI00224FF78B|nr:hypothetical protein [Streptomyces sp. NBC_01571]MCX4581231.1 hypothetical protein [Streptomyces sp. NBC_01571]
MHSQHNPLDSSMSDGLNIDDETEYTLAFEPPAEGGIPISYEELSVCGQEPLRLVVLLAFRAHELDGQPRDAEALYSFLTNKSMRGDDGLPVRIDDVRRALDFLHTQDLVTLDGAA